MRNKFLCITCSESQVGLYQFTVKLNTAILSNYIFFKPAAPFSTQSLAAEITDAVEHNNLFSQTYYVALNSRFTMLRNWKFPFTAKSKIKQALTFEIEQEIPLSQKDIITDIHLAPKTANSRNVVSASVPKQFLNTFLTELQARGIDPERIDIDAFALVNALSNINNATRTLLLDIDATRCLFIFIHEGQVVTLSQTPHELQDVKRHVMQSISLTKNYVTRRILFNKIVSHPVTFSKKSLNKNTLCESLNQLAKTILLGINSSNTSCETILLSGETTAIPGIDEFLSDILPYPVTSLRKSCINPIMQQFNDATGWGDCLQASGLMQSAKNTLSLKKQGMNFRKDEFSFRRQSDPVLTVAKYVTSIAIILLLTWSCSLWAEGWQKEKEAKAVTRSLEKTFHSALPNVHGNFSTIQYISILQGRLLQLKGETSLNKTTQADTIDILNELHKNISNQFDVTLDAIAINTKGINLRGTTDSLNTLEQVRADLSRSPMLKNIEIRGATLQNKERVRFALNTMRQQPHGK
ncbi:type IV pilus biogenesis protein PilM [Halodesulfovibrio marinisediminis]|uniref:Tfp pilus assembly protein, ATPase PilM n=1 Tax=Halodesulfovibrio marinisediminis DSM 17456 TaxID=1121457 RepID=A0A1N6H093_9BACT|nr:pilus assembly protein PilM [Halodesulfovibrio marinisediminis]SIO13231.1 Tfp pilus assembly protein, ATPase PilM [Halodesulfovibrio marinisediminis DSM 17456]